LNASTSLKSSARSLSLFRRRELALVAVILASLAAVLIAVPPIAQAPRYHAFADTRTLFSVPNFGNVASNLPFLLVGIAGLGLCLSRPTEGATRAWSAFFAGTALVAFGSGYYHWAPDSAGLLWDRLPMTIAFMGLLTALISEHIGERIERKLLVPAILVGLASAVWWRYTGDLRLYAWVQFAPLLAILFLLSAFPGHYTHRIYLLYGFVCYALAKAVESADADIYSLTAGIASGHSVKHLLAAGASFFVYLMLKRRQRIRA
jgi:hypothetical protein